MAICNVVVDLDVDLVPVVVVVRTADDADRCVCRSPGRRSFPSLNPSVEPGVQAIRSHVVKRRKVVGMGAFPLVDPARPPRINPSTQSELIPLRSHSVLFRGHNRVSPPATSDQDSFNKFSEILQILR